MFVKYLRSRNFELPSPLAVYRKKEFCKKLTQKDIQIKQEDNMLIYEARKYKNKKLLMIKI